MGITDTEKDKNLLNKTETLFYFIEKENQLWLGEAH